MNQAPICRPLPPTGILLNRSAVLSLLGTLVLLALPCRVEAHAIESSLEKLASLRQGLMLESHYSNGAPTAGAAVRRGPPGGGAPVVVGQMDARGRLDFTLPKGADGSWELQVDAGPGHRDYLQVPIQHGQAQLDQVSEAAPLERLHWSSPLLQSLLLIGGLGSLGGLLAGKASVHRRR
jgi:nickel transport protein